MLRRNTGRIIGVDYVNAGATMYRMTGRLCTAAGEKCTSDRDGSLVHVLEVAEAAETLDRHRIDFLP